MPDGGTGDYASRTEVAELRRQLRELRAIVAQLVRRRADPDSRLPDLLRMVYAFSRDRPWSASELLADARRAAPDLWILLDQITGQNGSAPIKLGLWLAKHEGVEADGLRLESAGRQDEVRLYRVVALR